MRTYLGDDGQVAQRDDGVVVGGTPFMQCTVNVVAHLDECVCVSE